LVTSGTEVFSPGPADFVDMRLHQLPRRLQVALAHADILRRFDARLNPKFRFSVSTLHVDVHPRLFAGKEIEAITGLSEYRRTHPISFAQRPNQG